MRSPLLLFLAVASASQTALAQAYAKADATGANDGSSWTNAYTDLQIALASAYHTLWVAAGTYRPSSTGDRNASFVVRNGRTVYGGFAGTETTLETRAGLFDATILTGDLLGDDGPGFTNVSDNSFHVVKLESGILGIDGFTVTGGNAEGGDGGGVIGFMVDATIENCTFRANRAGHGGGVSLTWEWSEGQIIRRCVFVGNHAEWGGGGLDVGTVDVATWVELCRFLGNTARIGGAISTSALDIVGCEFSGNSARGGGAVWAWSPRLQSCTIVGNSASAGGAAGGIRAEYPQIRDCIVWGNRNGDGEGESAQIEVHGTGSTPHIEGSCIQGWTGALDDGPGNLYGDPRCVDPDGLDDVAGTIDDDLRLGPNSSCVDTGMPPISGIVLPALDVGHAPRFVDALACEGGGVLDGVLDIGARERQTVDGSTSYCAQSPTSLGLPAEIDAPCVIGVAGGALHLRVGPVPSATGIIFYGSEIASTPFGGDTFCVGGSVHRAPEPVRTGNHLALALDLADPRAAAFVPGSTWHFQALFRDSGALRLSDATTITFRD